MNIKILLAGIAVVTITSCSTAYRSGQTPDDVYYSPARVVEEDYRVKRDDRRTNEDRGIRMSVYDRRWRDFNDDYDFRYDPYRYGYSYGYYYNPYYCHYPVYINNVVITNPKNTVPRMTNLGSYNNTSYSVNNTKNGQGNWINNPRPYNNSNNSNLLRRILTTDNTQNSRTTNNDTRSYTPSSNSSSGSSRGSGAPVSRPARGN